MSDATDPRRWFARAAQDLRSAANNLGDDPQALAEVICQDCHEACEKALNPDFESELTPVPSLSRKRGVAPEATG